MNKQTRWIILFVTLLLVAGLACQTLAGIGEPEESVEQLPSSTISEDVEVPKEPTVETSEPVDEPIDAEDSPTEAPPVIEDAAGDEGEDGDTDAGDGQSLTLNQDNNFGVPADAQSYRIAFSMEISASEGDEEIQVMNIVGEGAVSNNPPASSFDFQVLGAEGVDAMTEVSMVQIEDSTYIVSPIGGCVSGQFGQDLFDFNEFTDGANFVGGVSDARLVERNVEINGVNTDHYSFSQGDLDGSGAINESFENFQGDLYLSDEGYLVRIAISGEGSAGLADLAGAAGGIVKYQLDYFDVGEPVEITVPEGCDSAGDSELPIVSDATDLFSAAGFTTYLTKLDFDEIVNFYKIEMEADGWSLDLESIFENTATLSFERDGSIVTLIVAEDLNSDSFTVLLTEQ
ncbi:MAG: hypothetical protein BMS9Abin02_0600 [Anaerolineae bacterium]|nr:MAG: hypothetical protein BMS9Abin02_0600 [Anaerolineae bacterium]